MKKVLLLSSLTAFLVVCVKMYASSPSARGAGCTDDTCKECQVWQVTPEGSGMLLERGRNIVDWEEDGSNED